MAERNEKMSTKVMIIVFIGIAFLAGYVISRARYKPQINSLNTMVIERDDKISFLNNLRNRFVFRNDELLQIQDGEMIAVQEDVLLSNGTKVTTDGMVIESDGDTVQLNPNDSVFMDGAIVTDEEVDAMQEE